MLSSLFPRKLASAISWHLLRIEVIAFATCSRHTMSSSRPRRAVAMAKRKYTEAEESSEAEHSGNGDFSGDDEGVARNTKTRKTLQTSSQPRAKRARLRQPQPEQSSSSPGTSLNRPNPQTQSRLLTLPMELVDKIVGFTVMSYMYQTFTNFILHSLAIRC